MPPFCASSSVHCKDDIEWRGEIESVTREDWCGLERGQFSAFGVAVQGVSVKGPNGMKLTDVAASDLGGFGKTQTARISSVGRPALANQIGERSVGGLSIKQVSPTCK